MKILFLAISFALLLNGQAEDLTTSIGYLRATQSQVRGYVERAAEKMPDTQYAFKPDPAVRSFGEILGHIADAQYLFCSATLGEPNPSPGVEKSKKAKAELAAAIREAFTYCDKAYQALNQANADQTLKMGGKERARMGLLQFNTAHAYEHYGNLVVYMRAKGIVPPSSDR